MEDNVYPITNTILPLKMIELSHHPHPLVAMLNNFNTLINDLHPDSINHYKLHA